MTTFLTTSRKIKKINTCLPSRAYGGGKSFPIPGLTESLWKSNFESRNEAVGHSDWKIEDPPTFKPEARSAKRNQPQQGIEILSIASITSTLLVLI